MFLYSTIVHYRSLSRTIADYRSAAQRKAAQRSAAVVEMPLKTRCMHVGVACFIRCVRNISAGFGYADFITLVNCRRAITKCIADALFLSGSWASRTIFHCYHKECMTHLLPATSPFLWSQYLTEQTLLLIIFHIVIWVKLPQCSVVLQ